MRHKTGVSGHGETTRELDGDTHDGVGGERDAQCRMRAGLRWRPNKCVVMCYVGTRVPPLLLLAADFAFTTGHVRATTLLYSPRCAGVRVDEAFISRLVGA